MSDVSPTEILARVAESIPTECRDHIIIIGSLAVGYHFFKDAGARPVKTKDIDCVIAPRVRAVNEGRKIAERLLETGWQLKQGGEFGNPGTASTPDGDLPAIRLFPPGESEWFLELLTLPGDVASGRGNWMRLKLSTGHYGLPSFRFLPIATYDHELTPFGVHCSKPEMMALANLLEHPRIGDETISGLIEGRSIKRSNKDIGRVLAIAYLSNDTDISTWSAAWTEALSSRFPEEWYKLAATCGSGLRSILENEYDLEQATYTCQYGLLSTHGINMERLRIAGLRLLQDAIEDLERKGRERIG